MEQKRRKAAGVALFGNVIAMETYRDRARRFAAHRVLYLTDRGRWQASLLALPRLQVSPILSPEALTARLAEGAPDVIIVEAGLKWGSATEVIAELHRTGDVPIVLIYGAADLKRQPMLLKRAFAEGVLDMLRTPLQVDELQETLDVLLKFQRERLKAP